MSVTQPCSKSVFMIIPRLFFAFLCKIPNSLFSFFFSFPSFWWGTPSSHLLKKSIGGSFFKGSFDFKWHHSTLIWDSFQCICSYNSSLFSSQFWKLKMQDCLVLWPLMQVPLAMPWHGKEIENCPHAQAGLTLPNPNWEHLFQGTHPKR